MARTLLAIICIAILAVAGWYILAPGAAEAPTDLAPKDEWVLSEPNAQGVQFEYPQTLGTTYVSTSNEGWPASPSGDSSPRGWPPVVSLEAGEYSCAEHDERVINGRTYCLVETSEGAAGSIYMTTEYITAQGDFLAHVKFTLRYPQCLNYDEPQRSACTAEQSSFGVDALADAILESIRTLW